MVREKICRPVQDFIHELTNQRINYLTDLFLRKKITPINPELSIKTDPGMGTAAIQPLIVSVCPGSVKPWTCAADKKLMVLFSFFGLLPKLKDEAVISSVDVIS